MEQLASVAVGRPVKGPFTYVVPPELEGRLRRGQRVLVPFGRGRALGFYLGPGQPPDGGAVLRPVSALLEDTPALPDDVLALVEFAAAYYRHPLGEALRAALPPGLADPAEGPEPSPDVVRTVVVLGAPSVDALRRAPAQAATLGYLLAVGGRAELDELGRAVPGARAAVQRLVERGWVAVEERAIEPAVAEGLGQVRPDRLTDAQGAALAELQGTLDTGGFHPFLLQGVTGSGKTEVYLRAAEHALSRGGGALVLVPEIALTPQLVGRFRSRFGSSVAVLHSGLRDRERLLHWKGLRSGAVRLAVGVRSAVFAPVRDLALIVVDEEHDPSFKQDEKLRYQARDLAVVRAKQAGATVVLGSATPSLETLENARRGRYRRLRLPARVDDRPMPHIELVDLRRVRPRSRPGPSSHRRSRRRWSTRWARCWAGDSRPSSSSTAGATRPPWCARPAGRASPAAAATSRSPSTSGPRNLQCHYCGESRPLPDRCPGVRRSPRRRWARAPSGSRPRWRSAFPWRGWPGSTATPRPPPSD